MSGHRQQEEEEEGESGDSGPTTIKLVGRGCLDHRGARGADDDDASEQQIYIIETTGDEDEGAEEVVEDVAVYETVSALEQLSRGGTNGEVLQ
ncbi:Hypothetical protein FKW44_009856, partial [Caligus rogercresseyi]